MTEVEDSDNSKCNRVLNPLEGGNLIFRMAGIKSMAVK